MRRIWSANSVRVCNARSGAPNKVTAQTEPDKIPHSKPALSATRADSASHTVAGDLQTSPLRIARKRLRFSVGVIVCSHGLSV
jgi:hypothetical protein